MNLSSEMNFKETGMYEGFMVIYLIFVVLLCAMIFYFWRQARALKNTLQDLEFDVDFQKKESSMKIDDLQAKLLIKDKELSDKTSQFQELVQRLESSKEEQKKNGKTQDDKLRVIQNELDHFKTQTEVLLLQIRELDTENAQLKKTQEHTLKERDTERIQSTGVMQEENKRLRVSLSKLEAQIQNMQTELSELHSKGTQYAELLQRARRRVHQSDHLYKTIRGQKEMLEERLENWEKALQMLSLWILKEKEQAINPESNLGEVVSKALAITQHGPLMTDEEETQQLPPIEPHHKEEGLGG